MALDDADVREILRLIDESDVAELRVETDGLSLHVRRGDAAPEAEQHPEEPPRVGRQPIQAPRLGVSYRARARGATPFVEVGARVEATTVVCLIEVMKMMNAVPAGVAGTIVEICAANAEAVEYGATLFRVEPDT